MLLSISRLPDISHTHRSAREAVASAIAYLHCALLRYPIRKASRSYFEMQRDLPYFIQETALPATYILVNRNYKPLGSNLPAGSNGVKYEDFEALLVRLTPDQIASAVSPGCSHGLYRSINSPWMGKTAAQDYLMRLEWLYRLLVRNQV